MSTRQAQYVVAALVFALIFTCVGYLGYAASSDADGAASFSRWATGSLYRSSALMWMLTGAVAGLGIKFAFGNREA
jgi:hypothetical protein